MVFLINNFKRGLHAAGWLDRDITRLTRENYSNTSISASGAVARLVDPSSSTTIAEISRRGLSEFIHENGDRNVAYDNIQRFNGNTYGRINNSRITRLGYVGMGLAGLSGGLSLAASLNTLSSPQVNKNPTNQDARRPDEKDPALAHVPQSPEDAQATYALINQKLQMPGNEHNAKLLRQQALQYSLLVSANNLKSLNYSNSAIEDYLQKAVKGNNNLLTVKGKILPFDTPGLPELPPGFFPVQLSNGKVLAEQKYALSPEKQEVKLLDLSTGKVSISNYDIKNSSNTQAS